MESKYFNNINMVLNNKVFSTMNDNLLLVSSSSHKKESKIELQEKNIIRKK